VTSGSGSTDAGNRRQLQTASEANTVVGFSLRFLVGEEVAEAATIVSAYVSGAPTGGGNGLVDELKAKVPAIGSRLSVDASKAVTTTVVL